MIAGLSGASALLLVIAALAATIGYVGTSQALVKADRALDGEKAARRESEESLKNESAARREAEERAVHIEVLQTKYANAMSKMALDSGNYEAVAPISDLPHASWDSRYLVHAASQRPVMTETLCEGHWGIVAADLNRNGARLVSADAGGVLLVWDLQTGKVVQRLADGRFDAESRRWLHDAERRSDSGGRKPDLEDCYAAVSWVGNSNKIAAACLSGRAFLFDADSGQRTILIQGKGELHAVSASDDGGRILCGGKDGGLHLISTSGKSLGENAGQQAAVASIRWLKSRGQWLVGHVDGHVRLLRDGTLRETAAVKIAGPVWAVDCHEAQGIVAVGGPLAEVALLEITKANAIRPRGALALPVSVGSGQRVDCLRFSEDAMFLYAIADAGLMIAWDVAAQRTVWTKNAVVTDDRQRAIESMLKAAQPPRELPLPLRRRGTAILALPGKPMLITAGNDASIKVWQMPQVATQGPLTLRQRVGPKPQLAFSPSQSRILWALDKTGCLWAIDVESGQVVARREGAHQGGEAGISAPPRDDAVVTVGGDAHVRFWRLKKNSIVTQGAPQIQSERPLMSVAISPDQRWIAAVNVASWLHVWKLSTGELAFKTALSGFAAGKPYTGKAAFNPSGTLLAAFGAGQSGNVFACSPDSDSFRKLSDQVWVAGAFGGTAMAWNPVNPQSLIIADDYPRYSSRSFGEADNRANAAARLPSLPASP